jgi:peptidoglycan/LPS O-acetylase OafA/YrhL
MNKTTASRNTDIEVLRAVAISFTLCAHLIWGLLPKLGILGLKLQAMLRFWTGVDLFFGISGFIITSSLIKILREENPIQGTTRLRGWGEFLAVAVPFWIRRAFRLLPSAWLWILITLFLAATFNFHASFGTLRDNLHEAGAAVLNFANFYYYEWFAKNNPDYGSFGVYWSLSLEEQFYLMLPCLLFFVRRRFLIPVLLAAFFAQVAVPRPDGFDPHHTSLLWFVRTDALILGVLIAFWKQHRSYWLGEPRFLRRGFFSLPLVGLCVLLLATVPASRAVAPISTGLLAIISGVLVLIASYDKNYILPPSRFKTAMVWLGSRSYSIYLIHVTCHSFIMELKKSTGVAEGGVTSVVLTLACIPIILLTAEANYRLVETRFRRIGRHIADDTGRKLSGRWQKSHHPGRNNQGSFAVCGVTAMPFSDASLNEAAGETGSQRILTRHQPGKSTNIR